MVADLTEYATIACSREPENPFRDVPEDSFYFLPVLWAVENGITNGMSATQFGVVTNCNRAHMVTFLYRALN